MNRSYTPSQINSARRIPLFSVLQAAGARQDRDDRTRWHTTTGAISVTGTKFFNWNSCTGGGGAIDMVIHLCGLEFKDAVAWLSNRFPECRAAQVPFTPQKPVLSLPVPAPDHLAAVRHYLVLERQIPQTLIGRLISSDDIYADRRANAVFIARGKSNTPVGAELRGTSQHAWRGMAPGSHKNNGYFSARDRHISAVIICESAIDAISCLAIHPGHWCISTAGARPHPAWLPIIINQHPLIYCGFDADPTGDAMAQAMTMAHPAIKRLRPTHHDWNDVLCARR